MFVILQLITFHELLRLLAFVCLIAIANVLLEYCNWNLFYERLHLRTFVCIIIFWLTMFVCNITIYIICMTIKFDDFYIVLLLMTCVYIITIVNFSLLLPLTTVVFDNLFMNSWNWKCYCSTIATDNIRWNMTVDFWMHDCNWQLFMHFDSFYMHYCSCWLCI